MVVVVVVVVVESGSRAETGPRLENKVTRNVGGSDVMGEQGADGVGWGESRTAQV